MTNSPKLPRIPHVLDIKIPVIKVPVFNIPTVNVPAFQMPKIPIFNIPKVVFPTHYVPLTTKITMPINLAMDISRHRPGNNSNQKVALQVEPEFSGSFCPPDEVFDEETPPTDHEPTLEFVRDLTEEDLVRLRGDTPLTEEDEGSGTWRIQYLEAIPFMKRSSSRPVSPPPIAQWLVTAILPERRREAILGDLEERLSAETEKFGLSRARNLYRARVVGSLLPLVWHALKQFRVFGLIEAASKLFRS
jgi:hypothetical protein